MLICCRSYTEETTLEDLKKVLLTTEAVVHKLEKDPTATGGAKKPLTAAQRKKAIAAGVDVDHELSAEEVAENKAILKDWRDMSELG